MNTRQTIYKAICVSLFTLCLLAPSQARADAPEAVGLTYDAATQTLSVALTHPSTFTGLHYVKQIEVKKNNETVAKTDYSSQPGKTAFTYTYRISAAENDVLEATAFCNIQGKKTATLKVETKKN